MLSGPRPTPPRVSVFPGVQHRVARLTHHREASILHHGRIIWPPSTGSQPCQANHDVSMKRVEPSSAHPEVLQRPEEHARAADRRSFQPRRPRACSNDCVRETPRPFVSARAASSAQWNGESDHHLSRGASRDRPGVSKLILEVKRRTRWYLLWYIPLLEQLNTLTVGLGSKDS